MRGIIGKAPFHFQRLGQALQQIIQRGGQWTNFFRYRANINGFQITGFASRDFRGDFLQRGKTPADTKPDQECKDRQGNERRTDQTGADFMNQFIANVILLADLYQILIVAVPQGLTLDYSLSTHLHQIVLIPVPQAEYAPVVTGNFFITVASRGRIQGEFGQRSGGGAGRTQNQL